MKQIATLLFCIVFVFTSTAFASKKPLPPKLSCRESGSINILLPIYLEDNMTKIDSLIKIQLYFNGSDTVNDEKILTKFDPPGEETFFQLYNRTFKGFYKVQARLITLQNNSQFDTSNLSNELIGYLEPNYSWDLDSLMEDFEKDSLKYELYLSKNWNYTNGFYKSANKSLTNSINQKYQNLQKDTLIFQSLFLASIPEAPLIRSEINFWHTVHLDKSDTAYIEYSGDMYNWYNLRTISFDYYKEWQDSLLKNSDWKYEKIDLLELPNSNTGYRITVRLRFKSDSNSTNFGWYIDDLQFVSVYSGVESEEKAEPMAVYPNPASDVLYLGNKSNIGIRKIELISLLGTNLFELNEAEIAQTTKLDTRNLATGRYLLKVTDSKGRTVVQQVGVVR